MLKFLLLLALAALSLIVFPLAAQQADTGVVQAAFSGGGIFGLGAHGAVGGSLAAPVSKHLSPFIDFSYSPLTSYAFTYGLQDAGKGLFTSHLVDVNGGLRIRFPGHGDWVPYIGIGAGALHISENTNTSGFGSTSNVTAARNEFAGNASLGGLYYFTPHFGFEVELKGYAGQNTRLARATAGVFYQFPSK